MNRAWRYKHRRAHIQRKRTGVLIQEKAGDITVLVRAAKGLAWVVVMAVLLICLAILIYLYTAMDREGATWIMGSTSGDFGIHQPVSANWHQTRRRTFRLSAMENSVASSTKMSRPLQQAEDADEWRQHRS